MFNFDAESSTDELLADIRVHVIKQVASYVAYLHFISLVRRSAAEFFRRC
jgi:hypothetical protein